MSEGTPIKVGIAAGVLIEEEGKYLLVQEKKESCYGQWNLPAGKVDEGFTIEETAVKEAKEESGFDVELGRELCVVHNRLEGPVKHAFDAKIIGGELNPSEDEILDAKWFTKDEIMEMDKKGKLRNFWIINAIEAKENSESCIDRANMATWDDFEKIEIRVGKIIKVEDTEGLRISAYKMTIDFGEEIGQKISLGQYTANYTEETLEGRLVMCVINFEPKQIGSYISEALTLGFEDDEGNAVLAVPDKDVKIGQRLY